SEASASSNDEILLVKTDASGNLSWIEMIEDTGVPQHLSGVVELSTGDVAISYANLADPTDWKFETMLFRFDLTTRQIEWQRRYADLGDKQFASEEALPTYRHLAPAGNDELYLGAMSEQQEGIGVFKLNSNGLPVWGKVYQDFDIYCSSNSFAISESPLGKVSLMVQSRKDALWHRAHFVRLEDNGSQKWIQHYQWSKGSGFHPQSLEASSGGGLLVAGLFNGPGFGQKTSLMRLRANGSFDWQRVQNYTGQNAAWGIEKAEGHYLLLASEARVENLLEWDNKLEGVCSAGNHLPESVTPTISAPVNYVPTADVSMTLGLNSAVQSLGTPASTSVPSIGLQVIPQCEERLLIHYYDNCDVDCYAAVKIPAVQDAHFTEVNQIHSESLVTALTFDVTVDYLDSQGQSQQQSALAYNSCMTSCGNEEPLCNRPITPVFTLDDNPCETYLTNLATHYAKEAFDDYLLALTGDFENKYESDCLDQAQLMESLTMTYPENEYHYTLYYYDQAGNLVQTVPPAGVNKDGSGQHTKVTEYRYNSLNQLVWQHTPDGGESRFWYDYLGRIVFSQDAGQAVEGRYSYVKFDNLGRVAEGGEVDYNDGASILAIAFDQQGSLLSITQYDQVWTAIGDVNTQPQSFHEVTQTIYDLPVANAPQALLDAFGGSQDNLHNRVAAIHYQDMDDDTRDMTQHFEYDIHGNVSTMVTEIPALAHLGHRFKTVDYEYDLLSGSVTEVHYQDGEADQFHHRYSYDADNRIQLVETSKDKVVWEEDAHYEFYQHGPLARVELGEDRVQGVDYAYTLQGWLKTINSNLLTPDRDMGHDNLAASGGTLTTPHENFARDAFGFSIGYYEGDYSPIETPAIGAEF
ncbi:MAG: hypothetical protein AAFQ87_19005, partial [Bacteroidota bacterium]